MNQPSIKAVIFDLDGTLTLRTSWNYLAEYLGASAEEESKNFQDWNDKKITTEQADENILRMWRSGGRANKTEFTKAFKSIPLRPGAVELMQYLKDKGILVCLITGAMDLYAEVMAKRLGAQNYYANTIFHWDDNDEIKKFDYTPDQGLKKLEQFKEFCSEQKLNFTDCAAVGDSQNDYQLFQVTGKGIVIRSEYESKELEKVAWKIVSELPEITKYI